MARKYRYRDPSPPGAVSPDRIEELLHGPKRVPEPETPPEPSKDLQPFRIERLLTPDAAARLYAHIGSLITAHSDLALWTLRPPEEYAISTVNPRTLSLFCRTIPGFIDFPRNELQTRLKEASTRTRATRHHFVRPTQFAAANKILGKSRPVEMSVSFDTRAMPPPLRAERDAMNGVLTAITGQPVDEGDYTIRIGRATREVFPDPQTRDAFINSTRTAVADIHPCELQEVSTYYPDDDTRIRLYTPY